LFRSPKGGQLESCKGFLERADEPVIDMPLTQSDKIRVLTMITSFQIGGTERRVTNVSLGLDPERFDLHLACLRNLAN